MTVSVEGARAAQERLQRLGERGADVRPTRALVTPLFASDERTRFELEGPGWPALAQSTREVKARLNLDSRILRATGRLYDSLTSGGVELALQDSHDSLHFGTDVPYAFFHQYGKGVPRREVIELRPSTQNAMADVVQGYVAGDLVEEL
jgi:phage gpG-like protein